MEPAGQAYLMQHRRENKTLQFYLAVADHTSQEQSQPCPTAFTNVRQHLARKT